MLLNLCRRKEPLCRRNQPLQEKSITKYFSFPQPLYHKIFLSSSTSVGEEYHKIFLTKYFVILQIHCMLAIQPRDTVHARGTTADAVGTRKDCRLKRLYGLVGRNVSVFVLLCSKASKLNSLYTFKKKESVFYKIQLAKKFQV